MQLQTEQYSLALDDRTGGLRSLRSTQWPDQELLDPAQAAVPLCVVQYLDHAHRFQQLSSDQAGRCMLDRLDTSREYRVRATFTDFGPLDIDLEITLRCPLDEPLSYWSCAMVQRTTLTITDVQLPIVVVPYRRPGHGPNQLLTPRDVGHLNRRPRPEELQPDYPDAWQFVSDQAHFVHYPGTTFAQFLAAYDERQGVYLGCHDATGQVKIIKPVHHAGGIRLGIAHAVAWNQPGEHLLGYETALGVFSGDWYDAADLYRAWYNTTALAGPPLTERQDTPDWLLESPLHVVMRIQGELDSGPADPNPQFVPYEGAIPLLDRLAEQVDAPLLPIIMAWERPGPWVYPDCFPVAGGDESLRAFTAATRERGWHVGTYCNGTRWVLGHKWTGYDGETYYQEHHGEDSVCRLPDGTPWREDWDRAWRPSYMTCMGAPQTRTIAADFVGHLLGLGLDWIQFLDQSCGGAAFPCYSEHHGHAPAPGSWMTAALATLVADLEARAAAADRPIVFSVENVANDRLIAHIPTCDIRPDIEGDFVPLYHYLFHEYVRTQAAFALAPNPYWMEIKTALSYVLGDQPTAIMGPGGRLMAWAGRPWAAWHTPAGDQPAILALLRRSIAMRRGVGRAFLVAGRMLRPAAVQGIKTVTWSCEERIATLPAILHARWQSADGRVAVALANWTAQEQVVQIDLPLLSSKPYLYHIQQDTLISTDSGMGGARQFPIPPHSVALLEVPPIR